MPLREPYKGYVLRADPVKRAGGGWIARVLIERSHGRSVHYQPVSADPDKVYATHQEAERASIEFGKALVDSRKSA